MSDDEGDAVVVSAFTVVGDDTEDLVYVDTALDPETITFLADMPLHHALNATACEAHSGGGPAIMLNPNGMPGGTTMGRPSGTLMSDPDDFSASFIISRSSPPNSSP